jgi:hypothetical protein
MLGRVNSERRALSPKRFVLLLNLLALVGELQYPALAAHR